MLAKGDSQLFAPLDGFDELEKATFVVASVPVEGTVSYGGGTARGPAALLEASQQVELFDCDEQTEPYRKGIMTLPVPPAITSAEEGVALAYRQTKEILENGKIPILLGGEHSLSTGAVRAVAEHHGDISILHFDAHSDLRDSYHGDKHSHASVLRRCLEIDQVIKLVQVGIRNISNDPADGSEFDYIQANKQRISVYYAKDMKRWDIPALVAELGGKVYLTFDVDALDGALMPATGTPEPGGLDWYTTLGILKHACASKKIVGMDFVEFAPLEHFNSPAFLVAKLIYKTIGYIR